MAGIRAATKRLNDRQKKMRASQSSADGLVELVKETSRGAVIIGSAMIEDELRWKLVRSFKQPINRELSDALTGSEGSLGTFSRLINLACAMGTLSERERKILHLVRALRNQCAHANGPANFQIEEFTNCVRLLEPFGDYFKIEDGEVAAKNAFILFVVYFCFRIMTGSAERGMEVAERYIELITNYGLRRQALARPSSKVSDKV